MLCKYDEIRKLYFVCGRTPSELQIFLSVVNYITKLKINLDSESNEKMKMKNISILKSLFGEEDLEKYGDFRIYRYFFQFTRKSGFIICFKP